WRSEVQERVGKAVSLTASEPDRPRDTRVTGAIRCGISVAEWPFTLPAERSPGRRRKDEDRAPRARRARRPAVARYARRRRARSPASAPAAAAAPATAPASGTATASTAPESQGTRRSAPR